MIDPATPAPPNGPPAKPAPATADRRNFLQKFWAASVGAILVFIPTAIGVFAALDPLRRKKEANGYVRIAPLEALADDGIPRRFPVLADRTDAWNFFPNEVVGAVYLRRTGEEVVAFNVICPHLGCPIRPVNLDLAARRFECPCHNSAFELDGAIAYGPSPRPMDQLAVDVRENGGSKEVWVRFENFYPGIAEKVPKV